MATNKQLEQQVSALEKRVTKLSATNSKLIDEVMILKNNYNTLVSEVSKRLEVVQNRFQG